MKKLHLVLALAALVAAIVVPSFLKNYGIHLFTTWLVFIIATMGLNLTVGYAGQKSLGHAAFFGIGAYTVAIFLKAGLSFWLGLPAAALLCFAVGLILGFPALRAKPESPGSTPRQSTARQRPASPAKSSAPPSGKSLRCKRQSQRKRHGPATSGRHSQRSNSGPWWQ